MLRGLTALAQSSALVHDVRGRGLLLGLEFAPLSPMLAQHWFASDQSGVLRYLIGDVRDIIAGFAAIYVMHNLLQAHRIHTQVTRSHPRVLRIQPPLTVTKNEVDRFLHALTQSCAELESWMDSVEETIGKSGFGHQQDSRKQDEPLSAQFLFDR